MTTLKEIARAAGVSTATVSNVINGNLSKVSDEKVRQIRAIIDETGYIPNQAARSLAQRESRLIMVNVQANGTDNVLKNPYNAAFIGAVTAKLYAYGYFPLLRFTDDFETVERDIHAWNVAGTIFNGSLTRYLKQIKSLNTVPSVLTDCYYDLPGVNHVNVDDIGGGRLAGKYLMRMGHRRVGFIAYAAEESEVEMRRLSGIREILDVPGKWILPRADLNAQAERLTAMLNDPEGPTAFFCTSDLIAATLIWFLRKRGLRVPEDISVMGFDNLTFTEFGSPRVTTIAQDLDQKAALVVDMLMRHIQHKSLEPERAILKVTLVERDSVRRLTSREPEMT